MHFTFPTDNQDLGALRVDLCAVLMFEGEIADNALLADLDQALSGLPSTLLLEEHFTAKKSQCLTVHTHGKVGSPRLHFLGLGKRADFRPSDLRYHLGRALRAAASCRGKSLGVVLPTLPESSAAMVGQMLVEGCRLAAYQFDRYLTGDRKRPCSVETVALLHSVPGRSAPTPPTLPSNSTLAALLEGAGRGEAVASGTMLARDLVNECASEMTPVRLAGVAQMIAAEHGLEAEILGPSECAALGMGLYLAVSRGSVEEPRFLHLTYRPDGTPRRKVVIIGKSVTFDSGGLSLKTMEGMMDMKMDMGGGAAVLGAASLLRRLNCPDEVHILCAATENMPSGSAYKLGDVLRSMDGKSVEINNTDAEGRLTLADAITFAKRRIQPDEIIDLATLTGAATVALGPHIAAVMSNHQATADKVIAAGRSIGEESWQLPLPDRLIEQLRSEVADLKNCGERQGGCITAGLFLKEFVGETPWVHIDISGPVQAAKEYGHQAKGATGFGVAMLIEYLIPRAA